VNRPQDLREPIELDQLAGRSGCMIGGEATVVARVPVLGRDDEIEARQQLEHGRNDLVAFIHAQRPARQKVGLQIDDDQRAFMIHVRGGVYAPSGAAGGEGSPAGLCPDGERDRPRSLLKI
jgi:hypothetical protein